MSVEAIINKINRMNQIDWIEEGLESERKEFQVQDPDFQVQFEDLMRMIETTDWRKNLKKYINFYNLQIYKLEAMNPKSIRSLYSKLKEKYQKIQNESNRIYWFQNQLKIFVWLLIVSDQSFGLALDSYTDDQITLLSRPFFRINEDLCHYQYKLLTCLEFDEHWDQEENILLSELVRKYNFNCSWTTISKELFLDSNKSYLRTAHSCREKWQNHLDTRLVKGNWTVEDDYIIIKNRVSLGKKWSQIAKIFGPTRTEHMIKNRFKVILKRQSNKKEVRTIEQFDVCQQIERKLFERMAAMVGTNADSNTTANSPSAFQPTYTFKEVIVKVEQSTNTFYVKQGEFKPIPQGLEAVQTLSPENVKVDDQEWEPQFLVQSLKYDNSIPMLVDEEYLNSATNANLMEEPKLQFFF